MLSRVKNCRFANKKNDNKLNKTLAAMSNTKQTLNNITFNNLLQLYNKEGERAIIKSFTYRKK